MSLMFAINLYHFNDKFFNDKFFNDNTKSQAVDKPDHIQKCSENQNTLSNTILNCEKKLIDYVDIFFINFN